MGQHIIIQYAADKKLAPSTAQLKKWAEFVIKTVHKKQQKPVEVTLRIVGEKEMSELNLTYRNKKGPTNVLSFPFTLPDGLDLENDLLGDIVICAEVVNSEAINQGKVKTAHWAHMIVHGLLHLYGYDHELDDEAEKMEKLEIQLLKKLGFNNPYQLKEDIKKYD